jgi:hypothetical protein
LTQEMNSFIQAQAPLQQQLDQMRNLEMQHRQQKQLALQKIYDLESKFAGAEKQKEALHLRERELEEQLIHHEKRARLCTEEHKDALRKINDQLQAQKNQFDEELKILQQQTAGQVQHAQHDLEQEIKVLQERHQKTHDDYLGMRKELEARNEACTHFQERVGELNKQLTHHQTLLQDKIQQTGKLEDLKSELEHALIQTREQLEVTKQKFEKFQRYHEKLPYASGNTRRIESMYIQLKEQFHDKCTVLDATRRELFQANEKLLNWQKESEEEQLFEQSLNEKFLQKDFLELGQQYEQMQQQYEQEIDELIQLVQHLLHH